MNKSERENLQREMFSLIKKWQRSGISQKNFCSQHDLSIHAFWLRKYKQVNPSSENGFLPVEIGPSDNGSKGKIQIHYSNGVLITLSEAVSLQGSRH